MDVRRRIFTDVWNGIHVRDLLYVLVGRDIKLRYRGSVLGVLWSLLNPLAHLVVLLFVFPVGHAAEHPELSTVRVHRGARVELVQCLPAGGHHLHHEQSPADSTTRVSAAILPAVPVLSSLVHFAIAMALVIVVLVIRGSWLTPAVLALPLVVALQFLVTLSIGYVTATVQVRFRDTAYLVGVLLLLGFFLTPVFYRPNLVPTTYQVFYVLNPMAHLIGAYREILIQGQWPDVPGLLGIGAAATALLWLGHRMFTRASVSFAEET